MTWFRCSQRARTVAPALALAMLVSSLLAGNAQASITYCRSDPVIQLSNGDRVTLQADIADVASDVKSVAYVLHGPVGTSVISVTTTPGSVGAKENFKFQDDGKTGAGHRYLSTTTVGTNTSSVAVTATLIVNATPFSTNGYDKQALTLYY